MERGIALKLKFPCDDSMLVWTMFDFILQWNLNFFDFIFWDSGKCWTAISLRIGVKKIFLKITSFFHLRISSELLLLSVASVICSIEYLNEASVKKKICTCTYCLGSVAEFSSSQMAIVPFKKKKSSERIESFGVGRKGNITSKLCWRAHLFCFRPICVVNFSGWWKVIMCWKY